MNVAGGVGGQVGDLPVYISAIRAESAVARSGKIQVSETSRNFQVTYMNFYAVCVCMFGVESNLEGRIFDSTDVNNMAIYNFPYNYVH